MNTKNKNILIIAGSVLLGLLLGWIIFAGTSERVAEHTHTGSVEEETIWTCSMHPQIRQTEPGDCPICGMELIPLQSEATTGNPQAVQMSENALRLANVQTMTIGGETSVKEVRLNGTIAVDERRVSVQTSHVPGRIENLLVNFTGETVNRGQALARIYSPQLATAQQELLQAYRLRESQPELFRAALERFRNWRIGESQINRILESQEPSEQFTITADVSGVITEKMVDLGDYVERGSPIYQIADLSKVWVLFDVYENNMNWIQEGSTVEFTVASIPGETFRGTVQFIDPTLDNRTRVSTARVEVDNPQGRLKPGMFVSGVLEDPLDGTNFQVTVPKSAVLWTGRRSVVYVSDDSGGRPSFMLREVTLGPSLGDSYVVSEGLAAGEEVVVNGAFTVDAAAQLSGRPSMMSPEMERMGHSESTEREELRAFLQNNTGRFEDVAGAFRNEFKKLLQDYLDMKEALVNSNAEKSIVQAREFGGVLRELDPSQLTGEAQTFWRERQQRIQIATENFISSRDLQEQRQAFVPLSEEMIRAIAAFGVQDETVYVDFCPMANGDRGAFWLSERQEIRNPYYGEAMLTCGEVVRELD